MVVIEANIAWKSVSLQRAPHPNCVYMRAYVSAKRFFAVLIFWTKLENRLASAEPSVEWRHRCRSLSQPVLGSWYNFMNMVDWFWNEFFFSKRQITNCISFLVLLRLRLLLLLNEKSNCDAWYAHNAYPQCVFWTIPTGSRCVHCVTIHESVTRTIYECRSICCSQNNNVSLCWVDSNYTLYTIMCSFWHRYTFTLIPSSRVVDTNIPFVVRLVRQTTTMTTTHFYFIFMCIYCSIVRAVRLVLIQFNMLCVNTVVFQIMRHAGGVRSFRFPFCYIVPFFRYI